MHLTDRFVCLCLTLHRQVKLLTIFDRLVFYGTNRMLQLQQKKIIMWWAARRGRPARATGYGERETRRTHILAQLQIVIALSNVNVSQITEKSIESYQV